MKVQVLISCMHQKDPCIIERSNIQTDVVVVNQCDKDRIDEFTFTNKNGKSCHAIFINTTERGLSRSRNMALLHSTGDICLISDDDERFEEDYEEKILRAYESEPNADFISFACVRDGYSYPSSWMKMDIKHILKTSSIQVTFKRDAIIRNNIRFDVKMGSGTGNGGGEENKFMMDCKRKGLKMFYCPSVITTLLSANSQWYYGCDEKYFRNRGWASRRIMGTFMGFLFMWYNILAHRKDFVSKEYSMLRVIKYFHKGFFEKR